MPADFTAALFEGIENATNAVHYLPPRSTVVAFGSLLRSICGGIWAKNTEHADEVTCTVCRKRMVEQVDAVLQRG